MNNEERLIVDGYLFTNDNDVKMAEEEKKKIEFLEEKINYDNVDTVLKIYEKALQENIFKTPVGCDYLRKIRTEMISRGVPEENIKPIRLHKNYSAEEDNRPVRIYKVEKKKDDSKNMLRTSLWMNIALFMIVIGMVAIALMGETTNILNYRYKLENDYAAWEQELQERENAVREKERELNLAE